jgi:hypothetical protein
MYVERASDGTWTTLISYSCSLASVKAWALKPTDETQLSIWNDAREQYRVEVRWPLGASRRVASGTAPANGRRLAVLISEVLDAVVLTRFVLASALISGALYLIVDMDAPFGGPIQVSSAPLQRVMAEIPK